MDPKFQTSFIPKNPVVTQSKTSLGHISETNILSSIATTIFIITLILLGGLFGYKYYLNRQIATAESNLQSSQQNFDQVTIQKVIDADTRLKVTKQLLENHVAVSKVFDLLEELTLKKVSLSGFEYGNKDGSLIISATIEAQNYNALAQQYDAFERDSNMKDVEFSEFALKENGNVEAKMTAVVNPALVSYKRALESSTQ